MKINKSITREMYFLGASFLLLVIILKIVFYQSELIQISRLVGSLYFLFVVPGYFIMLFWISIDIKERVVIGSAISVGIGGIMTYLLGIFGVDSFFFSYFFPVAMIIVSIYLNRKIIFVS